MHTCTPQSLLRDLREAGFTVSVEGLRLLVGPGSRLSLAQVSAIREHRSALMDLVCPVGPWVPVSEWTEGERWFVQQCRAQAWTETKRPFRDQAGCRYIPLVRT
jgi:hypothetical protein